MSDVAYSREMAHFIHRETALPPRLTQDFKCNIKPDLVTVFEQVGDGLGHAVHSHLLPLDAVRLDPFCESLLAESYNTKRWVADTRASGPAVNGQPYLRGQFGTEVMDAERREQADYAVRNGPTHHGEGIVLGDRMPGQLIVPPGDTLDLSGTGETRQVLTVNTMSGRLPGRKEPALPGEFQDVFDLRLLHV